MTRYAGQVRPVINNGATSPGILDDIVGHWSSLSRSPPICHVTLFGCRMADLGDFMHRLLQRLSGASSDIQNSNLCAVCQNPFRGHRMDKELVLGATATAVLGQDFRQLEESVRFGCQLCQLRWNQLTPEQQVELKECQKVTYGFWKSRVGDGVTFEYWLDTAGSRSVYFH